MRKGIILAGGAGTRLDPITRVVNKHLLPVYDKPLIYYSLSTLMLAGAREVLVITTPGDRPFFEQLLGDGSRWGIDLHYAVQPRPGGLAQAFALGRDFLEGQGCALILGDNIFEGRRLADKLCRAASANPGATVFAQAVPNPQAFGVVEFGPCGKPVAIEEKPPRPRSSYAVTGLYFYDARAVLRAGELPPSARGEVEITDLNRLYLDEGRLRVVRLTPSVTWLDAGTFDGLLAAANLVRRLQQERGRPVGCPLETARRLRLKPASRQAAAREAVI